MVTVSNRAVYATQPRPLRDQIASLLKSKPKAKIDGEIVAVIVPDTNLLTGGEVAAEVYKLLEGNQYDSVILVSPSHTGNFSRISICSVDEYHTPLGNLAVNDRLRNELCDEDDDIFLDDSGHFHIEGIDVQLPFLQTVLSSAFDIVPIVMGQESPEFCRELGQAIGEVMFSRRVLVVASVNVLKASDEALDSFRTSLEERNLSRLMSLTNSDMVQLEGRGPVLVALIAALHNRVSSVQVLQMQSPQNGVPGFFGAILSRT